MRLLEVYLIIFRLDYIFIDSVLNLSESKFENELDSYREVAIEREKWILTQLSRIKSIFCITVKPSIDFKSHYQPDDADKEYTHNQYGLEKCFEKVTVWEQGISFITEVEADQEEDTKPQDLNREEEAGSVDRSQYSIMRDIVDERDPRERSDTSRVSMSSSPWSSSAERFAWPRRRRRQEMTHYSFSM